MSPIDSPTGLGAPNPMGESMGLTPPCPNPLHLIMGVISPPSMQNGMLPTHNQPTLGGTPNAVTPPPRQQQASQGRGCPAPRFGECMEGGGSVLLAVSLLPPRCHPLRFAHPGGEVGVGGVVHTGKLLGIGKTLPGWCPSSPRSLSPSPWGGDGEGMCPWLVPVGWGAPRICGAPHPHGLAGCCPHPTHPRGDRPPCPLLCGSLGSINQLG